MTETEVGAVPDRTPPVRPDPGRRLRRWATGPRTLRAAVVVGLLLVLELATFRGWLSGSTAPQWDFYNQYNTEAWAWWRDGGALSPPQWMPYAWGGYPALLDAQNSSWYLPVGLLTLVTPLTIHASAVLSALHVGFGALGVYVLLRSSRVSFLPAALGLTVWFFAAGPFSNATHLDISRAWAWMPWIFLVISASWRWDRLWRWLVAGLVLWQGALSFYPGILVATIYVGGVFVLVTQLVLRPKLRAYLLPLAVVAVAAAAMTTLRFLPLYLTRGVGSPSSDDASAFPLRMIGTFLYPYGSETLLNDVTMRSFFLAAPVFALLPFIVLLGRRVAPVVAATSAAAALGLPLWPWHDAVRHLPGMSLSRFTMSDFKPMLLLGLVVLAALVADRLAQRVTTGRTGDRGDLVRLAGAGVLTVLVAGAFLAAALAGDFDEVGWVTQYAFLAVSIVAVWAWALRGAAAAVVVPVLIVVAAGSGLTAALATPAPWTSDRAAVEQISFGAEVDDLMALYPSVPADADRRPARLAPDGVAEPGQALATIWGRAFYTGEDSVMGYVNLKGTGPFEQINDDLFEGDAREDALAFWSAPGLLIEESTSSYPTAADLDECVSSGACGVELTPVSYAAGELRYDVRSDESTALVANETWYPGWTATACPVDDLGQECRDVAVTAAASSGLRLELPAGSWSVSLEYRLPGQTASFVAFWAGLSLLVVGGGLAELRRRDRRDRGRGRADGPRGLAERGAGS